MFIAVWSFTIVLAIVLQTVSVASYTCDDVFSGKITQSKSDCGGEIESWCRIDLGEENSEIAKKYLKIALNSTNKLCYGCPEDDFIGTCKTIIACTSDSHCYKAKYHDASSYNYDRYYYGCAKAKTTTCFGTGVELVVWDNQDFSNGDNVTNGIIQDLLSTTTTSTTTTTTSAPSTPSTTSAPTTPSSTTAPTTPSTTSAPTTPSTTSAPTTPSTTSAPTTPSTTSAPTTPSTTSEPTTPSTTSEPTTVTTTSTPTAVTTTVDTNTEATTPASTPKTVSSTSAPTTPTSAPKANTTLSAAITTSNSVSCEDKVDHGFNCTEFEMIYKICSKTTGPSGEIAYTKCRKTCGHCSDPIPDFTVKHTVNPTIGSTQTLVLPTDLPPCQDVNTTLCAKYMDICSATDSNTHDYAVTNCAKTCNLCTEFYYKFYAQPQSSITCHQCGSMDRNVPCTQADIFGGSLQTCDGGKGYCMTDIYHDEYGNRAVYKRCVTEPICKNLWFDQTSDVTLCTNYGSSPVSGRYECHFCCTSEGCNTGLQPDINSLYLETRP